MSRKWTVILFLSTLSIFISCNIPSPLGKRVVNTLNDPLLFDKHYYCNSSTKENQNLLAEVVTLKNRVTALKSSLIGMPTFYNIPALIPITKEPLSPLILSKVRLEAHLNIVKLELQKLEGPILNYVRGIENRIPEVRGGDFASLSAIHDALVSLLEMVTRYIGHQCRIDQLVQNRKRDPRPSFRIQDSLKRGESLSLVDVMSLCHLFKSKRACQKEIEVMKSPAEIEEYARNLNQKYQKNIYDNFFRLEVKTKRFKCLRDSEDRIVMKLKFSLNGIVTRELVQEALRIWSLEGGKMRLEAEFVTDQGEIVFKNTQNLSHVFMNQANEIYLSRQDARKSEVIAHEVGHILGFPDCYVEFFDQKSSEIYYMELKTDNLMCAISSRKVPKEYFNELFEQRCVD